MAKVSFTNLKLKVKQDVKTVDFQGQNIEVIQYLPIKDKNDLVMISLQQSKEEYHYNPILFNKFFHLNMVYLYSNINFTDKQKEDSDKIYDTLCSNGLLDLIISNIPESEYNELYEYVEDLIEINDNYATSAAGLLHNLISDLPFNAQQAMDILKDFDENKFNLVQDFAQAANAGRPVPQGKIM